MTPRKRTVTREPDPQTVSAAITELRTSVDGQLETTGDLRERVKALETDSKHYATKADLANVKVWTVTGVAGALLSIVIALVVALVRSSIGN